MSKRIVCISACLLMVSCMGGNTGNNSNTDTTGSVTPELSEISSTQDMELAYPGSDISFQVKVTGDSLYIIPNGLTVINDTLRHDITGYSFVNAEIGDMNIDSYPEIFVYLSSEGSGSYGKLIGYSTNNGKSVSQVYLPEISENEEINEGYMGHDEMAIVESTFCQRFPIYKEGDSNAQPTGGMRQIQYKLVDGEAGRMLAVEKVVEF